MAEGDNRARQSVGGGSDSEHPGNTVKTDPTVKARLPEDTARSGFYATAGEKDVLPEHKARRDTYPHITATT